MEIVENDTLMQKVTRLKQGIVSNGLDIKEGVDPVQAVDLELVEQKTVGTVTILDKAYTA